MPSQVYKDNLSSNLHILSIVLLSTFQNIGKGMIFHQLYQSAAVPLSVMHGTWPVSSWCQRQLAFFRVITVSQGTWRVTSGH